MSGKTLLQNCRIAADGAVREGDVRIAAGRIAAIGGELRGAAGEAVVDAGGRWLLPGLIDDQVHFRQPGLTHRADIASESRAAVAGGITSFMEMPNTIPPAATMARIEEKCAAAAAASPANFAFYLGATRDNLADIAAADPRRIAGVKIFMGASTGNLLVDDPVLLEKIFAAAPTIIATHCENTPRIEKRFAAAQKKYGENIPPEEHPRIRDAQCCFDSSSLAVSIAKKTGARLHILHITTAKELELFAPGFDDKQITAEACVHHLLFSDADYARLGNKLKCNPAVKTAADRAAIRAAVASGKIDVLATDHAPHLLSEKDAPYPAAAAGLPLAEYALPGFLELVADGDLTMPDIARAGAERVADLFSVVGRGYIREGYFADLVLAEETPFGSPPRRDVFSKCGWTPFAGFKFRHRVWKTFVNGECVFADGGICGRRRGMALEFLRS